MEQGTRKSRNPRNGAHAWVLRSRSGVAPSWLFFECCLPRCIRVYGRHLPLGLSTTQSTLKTQMMKKTAQEAIKTSLSWNSMHGSALSQTCSGLPLSPRSSTRQAPNHVHNSVAVDTARHIRECRPLNVYLVEVRR